MIFRKISKSVFFLFKDVNLSFALAPNLHEVLKLTAFQLKTHIPDEWVCGSETNSSSPIPNLILLPYISLNVDGMGPTGKRTIWNLNGRLRPAVFAHQTCSIHIQQDSAWKRIGGVIIEMLVSVLQTH